MIDLSNLIIGYPETWKHSNSYLIKVGKGAIIDPGITKDEPVDDTPRLVIASHGHFDHLMGLESWWTEGTHYYYPEADRPLLTDQEANCSHYFAHARNFPEADSYYVDNERFALDDYYYLIAKATPGHTPGSSCLYLYHQDAVEPELLAIFTGDTVFANSIGRTDFKTGDPQAMRQSILSLREEFRQLDPRTAVFPGHGRYTTVGEILTTNPFFTEHGITL